MIYIALFITIIYLILIGLFIWGHDKINTFHLPDIEPKTSFTVVIPFRNEANNLPYLLQSIKALAYPNHLFEIIFVDDDSTDASVKIIEEYLNNCYNISIIKNKRISKSPKKDAITTAIEASKHDWIITTDADCTIPKYWLNSFDTFIQDTKSKCIVAPVKLVLGRTFLNQFQVLDMLSLQGATLGGFGIEKPFLCNGANLGYEKTLFYELHGFEGNTHIASGDDIFFLEKALKHSPKKVNYLKCEEAVVTTLSEISWKSYIEQRIRWGSKTRHYRNSFAKLTGLLVFLMNIVIPSLLILSLAGYLSFKPLLYLIIIKFSIDLCLIYKTASFFDQKDCLKNYFISFIIYPFISTYIVFSALFRPYKWKDRTFKT
ncbi:glycosyltransferase [Aestuariivivens sp. NBU2969]|uniref:glycosyltransferase family 2 protein n=1 Tax=Aestuariivivens sp. NBU2969 TaxID=2873267 RepID=UPI001CBC9536|nr:glycosyltransferase [Aestuariivivens sp. NBU2969]